MNALKMFGIWAGILIALVLLAFVLNFAGVLGERIIFENSFQYQEARKSAITTYEAELEQIRVQLMRTDLDDNTRANLQAQEASIRVLLKAERDKQR